VYIYIIRIKGKREETQKRTWGFQATGMAKYEKLESQNGEMFS
jgi:hypothetical protein